MHGGEKVSAIARTLGVSGQSLDNWVKAEAAGRLRDVRGKAVTAEQIVQGGDKTSHWSAGVVLSVAA